MAKKKPKKKAKAVKAVASNIKLSGFKKHQKKTIVIAAVVVLVVIALLFLLKSGTYSEAEAETESARADLVLKDITCLYLGNTPKYGPLGKYFGNVENVGEAVAEGVKVVVEFYDETDKLVGTHETGIVGGKIESGEKGAFFSYTEGLTGSFSTCKAKVE